jgi:hypothetical protein
MVDKDDPRPLSRYELEALEEIGRSLQQGPGPRGPTLVAPSVDAEASRAGDGQTRR